MIEFQYTQSKYIDEAIALALKEYKRECVANSQLMKVDFGKEIKNMLSGLFQQKYGKVAIQNGKVIGYLAFAGPWDGFFGNVKGVFSPLGGSAFGGTDKEKLASMLFEEVGKDIVADGVFSCALSRYAHDEEAGKSFVMNGFGIRCSDAILHLEERKKCSLLQPDYEFSELAYSERESIRQLRMELVKHIAASPVFFPTNMECFEESLQNEENRLFVVRQREKIIGYISVSNEGETFVSDHADMVNINGAFVDKKYRGWGVADMLLEYLCQVCEKEGKKYLGVDCETLNPTALRFWGKHFNNYTYSYARRIDERILDFYKY